HGADGPGVGAVGQPRQRPVRHGAHAAGLGAPARGLDGGAVAVELEVVGQRAGGGGVVRRRVPGEADVAVALDGGRQAGGRRGRGVLAGGVVAVGVHLRLDEAPPAGHEVGPGDEVVEVALAVEVEPGEGAAAVAHRARGRELVAGVGEDAAVVVVDLRAALDLGAAVVRAREEDVHVAVVVVVGPGGGVEVEPALAGGAVDDLEPGVGLVVVAVYAEDGLEGVVGLLDVGVYDGVEVVMAV